jgi:hypothetical protein
MKFSNIFLIIFLALSSVFANPARLLDVLSANPQAISWHSSRLHHFFPNLLMTCKRTTEKPKVFLEIVNNI